MTGLFNSLANPTRFKTVSDVMRPFFFWAAVICFVYGLYLALLASPPDYQQGNAVRIMYVHAPSAWLGLSSYLGLALCALFYLVWRHPLADIAARAIAPIGAGFTALTLVTGSLWGYPIWGTWWIWDARLTSMLVLLFFFIGYIALATGFERPERGARMASILALVGLLNLPIVKFSVDWWNTLHQPASILRTGGMAVDVSMLWPLFTMFAGFQLFFIWVVLHRMNWMLGDRRRSAGEARRKAI